MKLAWSDLTSMDYQFKNGRGFIDPHQSRYVDMSQLTGSGLEDMDFWADCFNDGMTRDAPNATMLSEDLKTDLRATGPLHPVANSPSPSLMSPAYTRHSTLPHTRHDSAACDLKNYDSSSLQRNVIPFQTLHDTTNGQTCKNHEGQSDCHHETRNDHWHEASPLRCQWKDCGSNDTFSNEGSLVRHLKAKHISPEKYRCPCRKSFGRKDRFRDHMRLKHPELGHGICNKCHEC